MVLEWPADTKASGQPRTPAGRREPPAPALFQLATELPAAVLARLLGIDITVAVAWQRASAGNWAAYTADISRRARYHTRRPEGTPRR